MPLSFVTICPIVLCVNSPNNFSSYSLADLVSSMSCARTSACMRLAASSSSNRNCFSFTSMRCRSVLFCLEDNFELTSMLNSSPMRSCEAGWEVADIFFRASSAFPCMRLTSPSTPIFPSISLIFRSLNLSCPSTLSSLSSTSCSASSSSSVSPP